MKACGLSLHNAFIFTLLSSKMSLALRSSKRLFPIVSTMGTISFLCGNYKFLLWEQAVPLSVSIMELPDNKLFKAFQP
jgi:hypothetical protein